MDWFCKKISEWKRSKRAKRVEFFCCLSFCCSGLQHVYIHNDFSFHMPPTLAIVLHFCPFTPYTTTLPLRLYHAHTSSALQHTYTISALQLADTLFSTSSLAGALSNRCTFQQIWHHHQLLNHFAGVVPQRQTTNIQNI